MLIKTTFFFQVCSKIPIVPTMVSTYSNTIFSCIGSAVLIATALASPPDLVNLAISNQGCISINFSANLTSHNYLERNIFDQNLSINFEFE